MLAKRLFHQPPPVALDHRNGDFLLRGVTIAQKEEGVGEMKRSVATSNIVRHLHLVQTIVLVEHICTILIDSHQQLGTIAVRQAVNIGLALQKLLWAVVNQMLIIGTSRTGSLLLRCR